MRSARSGHGAIQPAGFGKAALILIQDAVRKLGLGNGRRQFVSAFHGMGIAQGDRGLNSARLTDNAEAQPCQRVFFRFGRRFVLGFDHHRRASGGGNQDIGVTPRMSYEGLRAFGTHLAAVQHLAQQVAQGIIGAWFGLLWHVGERFR